MKPLKRLGLMALATALLAAFAGNASATVLTSNGAIYSGPITAQSEPLAGATSNHTVLHGPLGIRLECNSHIGGNVTSQTPTTSTAKGPLTHLTFFNCTNGYTVTVLNAGELEVHTDHLDLSGIGGNGTLTSTGATITIHTPLGFNCEFTTNNTHIGTITGSKTGHATLDVNAAAIPRTGHSGLCGATAQWTARYTITTPSNLFIH